MENVEVYYYAILDRWLDYEYGQNSFKNSLTYWTACQGMKSFKLGQILQKKGVGVTIGWDETNCFGKFTGDFLFQKLLDGYSLADAYQALSPNDKTDYCEVPAGAHLVYYPNSAGNMYLVSEEKPPLISISNITSTSATATVTIDPAKIRDGNTDKGTPVSVCYCISTDKNFGSGTWSNGAETAFNLSQDIYTFNNITFNNQPLTPEKTYYIYGWVKFNKNGINTYDEGDRNYNFTTLKEDCQSFDNPYRGRM